MAAIFAISAIPRADLYEYKLKIAEIAEIATPKSFESKQKGSSGRIKLEGSAPQFYLK